MAERSSSSKKKKLRPTNFFFVPYSILLCHTSATFYESTLFCKKKEPTTMSLDLLSRITQQEWEKEQKKKTIVEET
jgi:hypothetical protein